MRRTITSRAALATTLVLASLLAACGGPAHVDKSGGAQRPRTVTLAMPAPDGDDADAAYFAAQVKARTDGRVRIAIDGETYTSIDPDNELRLVRDLRAGKVGLAYLPSRAWERDGVGSFRALQAPFLVGDYATLRQVAIGPIGAAMMQSLDKLGLVGLGLVPKELRRPLGRRPLTSVPAFRGARIRVVTSPTGELALRSLGARPVAGLDAHQVSTALGDGRLDGVETELHAVAGNEYTSVARYLPANLPLFAKAETLVIRRDALGKLSASDQAAVRSAASATVAHADPAALERTELAGLCGQGLRLVHAAPGDVAALRREGRRAYATLERDPATRNAIAAIQGLDASGAAASLPGCPRAKQTPAGTSVRFPQGRYESRLTDADFRAGGTARDPSFPDPWAITMRDGRWNTNESPPFGGHYVVRGDRLTFVVEFPRDNAGQTEKLEWSYYRGRLTLDVIDVADSGSRVIYTAHPWRRTGN